MGDVTGNAEVERMRALALEMRDAGLPRVAPEAAYVASDLAGHIPLDERGACRRGSRRAASRDGRSKGAV
jgi:hypothetical protein